MSKKQPLQNRKQQRAKAKAMARERRQEEEKKERMLKLTKVMTTMEKTIISLEFKDHSWFSKQSLLMELYNATRELVVLSEEVRVWAGCDVEEGRRALEHTRQMHRRRLEETRRLLRADMEKERAMLELVEATQTPLQGPDTEEGEGVVEDVEAGDLPLLAKWRAYSKTMCAGKVVPPSLDVSIEQAAARVRQMQASIGRDASMAGLSMGVVAMLQNEVNLLSAEQMQNEMNRRVQTEKQEDEDK